MSSTKSSRKQGALPPSSREAEVGTFDRLHVSCDQIETLASLLKAVDERELLPPMPVKNAGIQILKEMQEIRVLLVELRSESQRVDCLNWRSSRAPVIH